MTLFLLAAASAPPAGAGDGDHQGGPNDAAADTAHVPGELLVQFRPGADASDRAAVRARNGLEKVRDLPLEGVELVRYDSSDHPRDKADQMRFERSVRWAEPNQRWQPSATPPDDTRFEDQWALENTGQTGGTAGVDIGALDAWEVAADTSGVVVAVIDTGADLSHSDLAGQAWTNTAEAEGEAGVDDDGNGYVDDIHGWDFFNDDASVYDGDVDDDGVDDDRHGTHVAGTVAATRNNAAHVAGVSQAQIMPLKFLGPDGGTTANAVLALDYAIEMGAHITNNSWGGSGESQALADKITEAEQAGVFVVAAAGNAGGDNDATPTYPASYPHANVVSVAATDHDDALASFSNYGETSVDLGAPGVDIVSTTPGDSTSSFNGTSMAAPHVSGALAHVLASYPELSPSSAKDLLLDRAEPLAALETKTVSGGRLDLASALGVDVAAPEVSVADTDAAEVDALDDATSLAFPVTLSAPHTAPVTLTWSTGDPADTATADVDYTAVTDAELTLAAGQTTGSLTVTLIGDDEIEDDETLTTTITSVTEATIADGVATGTIVDDDQPVASVTGPAEGVGEADGQASFTVELSGPSPEIVEVGYATADGTATAPDDYTATSGTLTFDGTTSATVDVAILDDSIDEADEQFSLVLSDATNAVIGDGEASATIVDDDVAPEPEPDSGGSTGGGGGSTGGGGGDTTTEEPTSASSDPEGSEPSEDNPLVVGVSGPAGPITVTENDGGSVPGYAGLGHGVDVEAPDGTVDDPLTLLFSFHVPAEVSADRVVVARDGVAVTGACTAPGAADPDPCEASRTVADGVLTVTVLSSHASQWDLAVPTTRRLAGDHRVATAIAVSQASWDDGEAGAVVLARADTYPDALAGGALAASLDAPLLLTASTELGADVAAEATRVLPDGGTVHLLGGSSALSPDVADALRARGLQVARVSGADRFATAVAIAEEAAPSPAAILVTTGTDFPDALAASAAAGHLGGAVVLTAGAELPAATEQYLAAHPDTPVYAVGGPADSAVGDRPGVTSLAGADRYETAALVAERLFDGASMLGVATGADFPDALAAGARLGRLGVPLVLSLPTSLPDRLDALVGAADRVELYGGVGALSAGVEEGLAADLG